MRTSVSLPNKVAVDDAASAPPIERRKSVSGVQEASEITPSAEPATGPVRRPKKGEADYIKRPENAFILFRRKCVEDRVQAQEVTVAGGVSGESAAPTKAKKARQADLSKLISEQWRSLSAEERTHWENLAKEKKREHEMAHPDYVYRPQRTKKVAPKSNPKKGKGRADPEPEPAPESVSFMLPLPPSPTSRHGRSSSAPNARFGPSAAMIRLPVVTMPNMPPSPLDSTTPDLPLPIRRTSYDWQPRSVESPFETMGGPFQLQPQFTQQPMQYYQWDAAMQPSMLPSLLMPTEVGMYSSGPSPAETASPATPYPGPFTTQVAQPIPQAWQAEPADVAMVPFDLETELPALCDIPWTHEFVGEFVPGGLLSDGDFDLSAIAPVTLDELCDRKGGAWDLSALDLGAGAVLTTGQDPLEFFINDPTGTGRF